MKYESQINKEKSDLFYEMINKLGGYIKLKKPIRFRETPHMPTKYIFTLSSEDDFEMFGLAKDTVLQILRLLLYEYSQ